MNTKLHAFVCLQIFNQKYQLRFIDSLRLNVKGGHGGTLNRVAAYCEFYFQFSQINPICLFKGNGYPKYGGIGGQGGCIQFEASEGLSLTGIAKK